MQGDDPLREGKPQAKSPGIARSRTPVERLKDLSDLFGGNSIPLVDNLYEYLVMRQRSGQRRIFLSAVNIYTRSPRYF